MIISLEELEKEHEKLLDWLNKLESEKMLNLLEDPNKAHGVGYHRIYKLAKPIKMSLFEEVRKHTYKFVKAVQTKEITVNYTSLDEVRNIYCTSLDGKLNSNYENTFFHTINECKEVKYEKIAENTSTIEYDCDENGNTTEMVTEFYTVYYEYDYNNNCIKETKTSDFVDKIVIEREFDDKNRVIKETYDRKHTKEFEYNIDNKVTKEIITQYDADLKNVTTIVNEYDFIYGSISKTIETNETYKIPLNRA